MRHSLFLLTLLSFSAFAQVDIGNGTAPCDDGANDPGFANGGTFECSQLDINGPITFNLNAAPLIIKVRGDVNINVPLDLSGGPGGPHFTFDGAPGGQGGPGAGNGGGDNSSGVTFPANDNIHPTSASRGLTTPTDPVCGNGGGGGGFKFSPLVVALTDCDADPSTPPPANGALVANSEFNLPTPFRGGFGGGAGGAASAGEYGSGGGGGGAIHIVAGGDINIAAGASILANGGDGGDGGATDGGGGGAGSGGVIWLQALGNIVNQGDINAAGGTGGTVTGSGGVGGNGGRGFILLEDLDGVITGGGTTPGWETQKIVSLGGGSGRSLKSDISCGSIKASDDENHSGLFQMLAGFFLVGIISQLRKLKLFA